VVNSLNVQNPTLPSGTAKIGDIPIRNVDGDWRSS